MAFDIQGARQAGISDDEIKIELGSVGYDVDGALNAGVTLEEIAEEVSKGKPSQQSTKLSISSPDIDIAAAIPETTGVPAPTIEPEKPEFIPQSTELAIPQPDMALQPDIPSSTAVEPERTEEQGFTTFEKSLHEELKKRSKTLGRSATGIAKSLGNFAQIFDVSRETGDSIVKSIDKFEDNVFGPQKTFDNVDKVIGTIGSGLTFFIPGLGAAKGAQLLSKAGTIGPKLGMIFGAGTMSVLESSVEAGSKYDQMIQQGENEEAARQAALITFGANLPLNAILDKWMFAPLTGTKTMKEALKGGRNESVQETIQTIISNISSGDLPELEELAESAILGAVGGAGFGVARGVTETIKGKPEETVKKEEKVPKKRVSAIKVRKDVVDEKIEKEKGALAQKVERKSLQRAFEASKEAKDKIKSNLFKQEFESLKKINKKSDSPKTQFELLKEAQGKTEEKLKAQEGFVDNESRRAAKQEFIRAQKEEQANIEKAKATLRDNKAPEISAQPSKLEVQETKETETPTPERALHDSNYEKVSKKPEKKSRPKRIFESVVRGGSKAFPPISTRLGNINPKLKPALRRLVFNTETTKVRSKKDVESFLKVKKNKMPKEDQRVFDLAEKNRDVEKINELNKKYGTEKEYKNKRAVLNRLFVEARQVGFDVGYLDDFAPRVVVDYEGLSKHLKGTKEWSEIDKRIRDRQEELQRPLEEDEKIVEINKFLQGFPSRAGASKPGQLKQRKIKMITPEMDKFYATGDEALLSYIDAVSEGIAIRKFFGKHKILGEYGKVDLEKSISSITLKLAEEGKLTSKQEKQVSSMLESFFIKKPMNPALRFMRDVEFLETLGTPLSAITQIGDLGFTINDYGIIDAAKGLAGKRKIRVEEFGLKDKISEEFTAPSTSTKILRTVFKTTGFSKMDEIGKTARLNGALANFSRKAKKNSKTLREKLEPIFEHETDQVMEDLKNENITDNVRFLVFSELLDVQPIARSEMPEAFLRHPNARILYMLKTFTLRQVDVFRRKAATDFKKGNYVKGTLRVAKLAGIMAALGAGTDVVKDLITGRKMTIPDLLIDNLLKLTGINKYVAWQVRSKGIPTAFGKLIAPPHRLLQSVSDDVRNYSKGKLTDIKDAELVKSIPWFGNPFYWRFGGGVAKKKRYQFRDLDNNLKVYRRLFREKKRLADKLIKDPKNKSLKKKFVTLVEDNAHFLGKGSALNNKVIKTQLKYIAQYKKNLKIVEAAKNKAQISFYEAEIKKKSDALNNFLKKF